MRLKSLVTVSGIATLVTVGALANAKPASTAPADGIVGDVAFTSNSLTFSNVVFNTLQIAGEDRRLPGHKCPPEGC